jgi:hypothetical protein
MSFLKASDLPAIPTYRVIDSDGELVDKSRGPPDVSDEEVLTWYKNMLTGMLSSRFESRAKLIGDSEHYGCGHVRGTTPGTTELLYGMIPVVEIILKCKRLMWEHRSQLAKKVSRLVQQLLSPQMMWCSPNTVKQLSSNNEDLP